MRLPLLKFARSATGRLALSYWTIIMVLCLGFSVIFYQASVGSLGRNIEKPAPMIEEPHADMKGNPESVSKQMEVTQEVRLKLEVLQAELWNQLLLFNLWAFVISGGLSYVLARWTLRPVEIAIEAQGRFVSDASHELRTPLAVMQAENEEGLSIPHLPPAARRLIASNLEEINRLRALSEGLLQLARDDAPLMLHAVWADDVATEAINRMVRPARAAQIAIEDAWPPARVLAYEPALTQITLILLDNAIKYSRPGSTIYLEHVRQSGMISLQVRDTGVGISATNLPRIFDRFYRVDASRTKRQVEGHGLGLSIAQKLAVQQGGRITVKSTLGEGSVFSLELPQVV